MRWAGYVVHMGERRGVCRVMVRRPEGKRPPGRPRSKWEDNIKMDLQEVGCGVWSGSTWLRRGTGGGTCECGNELSVSIECGELLD
jgi:hypothetical protein